MLKDNGTETTSNSSTQIFWGSSTSRQQLGAELSLLWLLIPVAAAVVAVLFITGYHKLQRFRAQTGQQALLPTTIADSNKDNYNTFNL